MGAAPIRATKSDWIECWRKICELEIDEMVKAICVDYHAHLRMVEQSYDCQTNRRLVDRFADQISEWPIDKLREAIWRMVHRTNMRACGGSFWIDRQGLCQVYVIDDTYEAFPGRYDSLIKPRRSTSKSRKT